MSIFCRTSSSPPTLLSGIWASDFLHNLDRLLPNFYYLEAKHREAFYYKHDLASISLILACAMFVWSVSATQTLLRRFDVNMSHQDNVGWDSVLILLSCLTSLSFGVVAFCSFYFTPVGAPELAIKAVLLFQFLLFSAFLYLYIQVFLLLLCSSLA